MKIIGYKDYEIRSKRALKNISGCGVKEKGIKAIFKFLCFKFNIKILKIKFDENAPEGESHLFDLTLYELDSKNNREIMRSVNIYTTTDILNKLNSCNKNSI